MRTGGRTLGPVVALGFALAGVPALAHRIQKHFKVDSHPVLTLHNSSGHIVIRSWQKQEVQVVANHKSQKVEVNAERKGNMVEVSTHILTDDVTPADLEADFGLPGGQLHHGEPAIDQTVIRPIPECFNHETPVRGLTLCGCGKRWVKSAMKSCCIRIRAAATSSGLCPKAIIS